MLRITSRAMASTAKRLATLLSGVLMEMASFAQELPQIINFSPQLMQAAHQNWSVAQSPFRYIFSGNTAGLVQYDGTRWKLLPLPNRQIVRSVASDKQGNVFCGGFGEFGFWRTDQQGAKTWVSLADSLQTDRFAREEIWHIVVWEGKVYFQSFSALYVYDYRTVRELQIPGNIMFLQAAGRRLLLPVIGRGIFEQTPTGQFRILPGTEVLSDRIVAGIAALGTEELLIGTERDGLFRWRYGQLERWNTPAGNAVGRTRLNRILALTNGHIAIGTIGEGVYICNAKGQTLYHIHRKTGLQNNTVLALYEDADQNLWVGMDKGLDLLALNIPLRFSLDQSGSLGTVFAATIHEDKLYLGTNQGLFCRPFPLHDIHSDQWTAVAGINGQVWELTRIGDQLLCGHNDGSHAIAHGRSYKVSDITGGWVSRMCPQDSSLWIQGTYTGLSALRYDARAGLRFAYRIEGFSEPVEYMEFDPRGRLLVVHPYRGIHLLALSEDKKNVRVVRKWSNAKELPTDFNLQLSTIHGRLILKSGERFFEWDHQSDTWIDYQPPIPLNGSELALIPAHDQRLFVVYADKVVLTGSKPSTVFHLRLSNDRPNILPLQARQWLFCLEDGYALWDEQPTPTPPATLPLVFTEAMVKGRNQWRHIHSGEALAPHENQLSIHFSCFAFDRKPLFRRRMPGIHGQWSAWQENSSEDISFLPAGSYQLEVQCDQSPHTAVFAFRIRPRWYNRWYMRVLYACIAAAGGFYILYQHRRRLERKHRKQLIERERQLNQQRIQERNEQLQQDVFKKAKDLANTAMHLIRKNEVLLEIKQGLARLQGDARVRATAQHLTRLVEQEISSENDWAVFEENFNSVHEAFLRKLKQRFPELTPGDLRLAAYLKMNLSSKEIAPLLGISLRGVENKRYRLRHKMNLAYDENLVEYLLNF